MSEVTRRITEQLADVKMLQRMGTEEVPIRSLINSMEMALALSLLNDKHVGEKAREVLK